MDIVGLTRYNGCVYARKNHQPVADHLFRHTHTQIDGLVIKNEKGVLVVSWWFLVAFSHA